MLPLLQLTRDWYCDNMGTVTGKRRVLSVEEKVKLIREKKADVSGIADKEYRVFESLKEVTSMRHCRNDVTEK
jgi:uncharacterized protein (DUF736 family)